MLGRMSEPSPSAISTALIPWYRTHARDLPWRRPGFGAWGVLVSEFMLQQTPVTRVIPHLEAWLARWPSPADLSAAPPAEAVRQWANLGYPRRALWLHRAAEEITQQHGGVVPDDVTALLALTGIGDYTARAVAVFAYGRRAPVVDTNTRRVIARACHGRSQPGAAAKRDLEDMSALLPSSDADAALVNAATMELGALVCTSRAPRCEACPLSQLCAWRNAGFPDTGDTRPRQARYEGSDRQVRGALLRAVRDRAPAALPAEKLDDVWADTPQRGRALDSLIVDGLLEVSVDGLSLPSGRRSLPSMQTSA